MSMKDAAGFMSKSAVTRTLSGVSLASSTAREATKGMPCSALVRNSARRVSGHGDDGELEGAKLRDFALGIVESMPPIEDANDFTEVHGGDDGFGFSGQMSIVDLADTIHASFAVEEA